MNIGIIGTRGTKVIRAALKCGPRFSRDEILEQYARLSRDQRDALPLQWSQGVSNQIQRLGSGFSQYDPSKPDLIARRGKGLYCFQDGVYGKLVAAADVSDVTADMLGVPFEGAPIIRPVSSHEIGRYAQRLCMQEMARRGHWDIRDTSQGNSYDFTFRLANDRPAPPQTMECKGTLGSEEDFSFTPNEWWTLARNYHNHWLGTVTNIKITNGVLDEGTMVITEPPIDTHYQFLRPMRFVRRPPPIPGLFALAGVQL